MRPFVHDKCKAGLPIGALPDFYGMAIPSFDQPPGSGVGVAVGVG